MSKEVIERVLDRVVKDEGGCWNSQRCRNSKGYTTIWADGRTRLTHRVMYEAMIGPIPTGLQIDHKCKNRICCNPDHLEPVTPRENTRRAWINGHPNATTHCPAGHEYTAADRMPCGTKQCRRCANERRRKRPSE